MRARHLAAGVLALAGVLLSGCAIANAPVEGDGATEVEESPMESRPPMEEVLERYEGMQRDLVDALTADPGGLVWEPDAEGLGLTRAKCPEEGPDAETATLRGLVARGGYEGEARARSLDVVKEITERHGFGEVTTVVDRPDGVRVVAEDTYGGRVYYGTAVNTTLLVMTGCHVWGTTPGPEYERP